MILLIEDNSGDVVLFKKALAATRSLFTVARSAEAGIDLLRQRSDDFNIVVVDLKLSSADGWLVLEYLHDHPNIKAKSAILTSSSNERDRARALSLGVGKYWIKPDEFDALQKIVLDISALDYAAL